MNLERNKNDDGVSPVVGVILMVAITVILAAVVFVLVSNLGHSPNRPVDIGFSYSDSTDVFSVVSEPSEPLHYSALTIKDNGTTITYKINNVVPSSSVLIRAGDIISFSPSLSSGVHNLSFVIDGKIVYSTSINI